MAGRKEDWVYDELLNYVASPLFQAPVITFMETNCLIFDPSIEDCKEYRELHGAYCALVTVLLDAFRQDTNLTHEQIIKAMTEMSKKPDIREVFSGVFELILATESFRLFSRLMIQKNLDLQQQALMLIMKQYGQIPDIMQADSKPGSQSTKPASTPKPTKLETSSAPPATPAPPTQVQQQEEEIMHSIIKTAEGNKSSEPTPEVKQLQKTAEEEAKVLSMEKQKEEERLAQVMKQLKFEEPAAPAKQSLESTSTKSASQTTTKAAAPSMPDLKPVQAPVVAGGGDAAAMWIAQAKAESEDSTQSSAAVTNAAASLASLTPDELKKRQEFLKQQKEKLMALKQKEREKQLTSYEQKVPSRPKSSRAARSMLSRAPAQPEPEQADKKDGEKTMEMRRAIANRLKAEVLGK